MNVLILLNNQQSRLNNMLSNRAHQTDTSQEAYKLSSASEATASLRADIFEFIAAANTNKPISADCLLEHEGFRRIWRDKYQNEHHFLQDIRRRISELKRLGKIYDTGIRVIGIGGKSVACLAAVKGIEKVKMQKVKNPDPVNIMRLALQHYAMCASFHTGMTARNALVQLEQLQNKKG